MKITILSPVKHDGADLVVGETTNMPDIAANALIEAGAAEAWKKVATGPEDKAAGGQPA